MAETKKASDRIREKLGRNNLSAWERSTPSDHKAAFSLGEEYKDFLRGAKTEREIVAFGKHVLSREKFVPLSRVHLAPGKRFLVENKGKNLVAGIIGKKGLGSGLRVIVSHIDANRLDWKSNPFYEDGGQCFINLHYYGGIKKYHWVNLPLALHGTVFLKNGKRVEISLGEKSDEPVFSISDLLPHVGGKTLNAKTAADLVPGEQLDAVAATIPLPEKDTREKIKLRLLELLHESYGLVEEDFFSAELQLVPAIQPRDVGFDRSLIGAYAHDDRACSFAAMNALLDVTKTPEYTSLVVWMDKEEIGSTGATGSESLFLENTIETLCAQGGTKETAHQVLASAYFISADVTSALDSKYKEFFDVPNTNRIGYGVSVERETGYGGKYDGSHANAEYLSFLRSLLNSENIAWQTGEIGKVDEGGGGTVAKYFARYGCEIADVGPPVLAMHSPFELLSKIDLYMTYKAYLAFLEGK